MYPGATVFKILKSKLIFVENLRFMKVFLKIIFFYFSKVMDVGSTNNIGC